ncbi:aminopeptidase [Candidatus Pacearchaeota archaeon]|nr:aminopeptidase [Candidatus Pacearchaeota archaeon]MBD3283274.1 aminopeptidase [Candidatus Pacearchaeota archaeon]
MDPRIRKLAQTVVRYSLCVKPDSYVIVSGGEESREFILELYKEIIFRGAHPVLNVGLNGISDFFYKYASDEQLEKFPDLRMHEVKKSQYYVGINTTGNTRELSGIDPKKIMTRRKVIQPLLDYVVNRKDKIKRVTVGFPCMALAQEAEMSFNEYENFVFSACLIDWKKFGKKLDKIARRFEKGKEVWLKGENVDLRFSIKGKNCVSDKGEENMPGGEVFMAPVRESLNGWIFFEYPAIYSGKEINGIFLRFENGKVVEHSADKNEDLLREVLETDDNSSYVGEFGIGCNPGIKKYTKNLLFDEKIHGTIHLALGMAYKENGGGNDSAIHWDIVKDMKNSKIFLDGKIIQDNKRWRI